MKLPQNRANLYFMWWLKLLDSLSLDTYISNARGEWDSLSTCLFIFTFIVPIFSSLCGLAVLLIFIHLKSLYSSSFHTIKMNCSFFNFKLCKIKRIYNANIICKLKLDCLLTFQSMPLQVDRTYKNIKKLIIISNVEIQ